MEFKKMNTFTDNMKHSQQLKNQEIWVEDYDSENIFEYMYYIGRIVKIQKKYNTKKKITFKIHSYGGSAHGVFSLISTIEQLKRKGWIIETIGKGMSMSAGGMLLMAGSKNHRYAESLTDIMIHQQNWGNWGHTDVEKTRRDLENAEKMLDKLKMLLEKYTNISAETFERDYVSIRKDWYMNPSEAKSLGIIDAII